MDQNTLVMEERDAGAEFVRRFHAFMPVEAAFWVRMIDDQRWTLCLVSPKFTDATFDLAYGEVVRLALEMKNPCLDPFQVKLLRASDPGAAAAAKMYQKYPGDLARRFNPGEFNWIPLESVYLYPKSIVNPTH